MELHLPAEVWAQILGYYLDSIEDAPKRQHLRVCELGVLCRRTRTATAQIHQDTVIVRSASACRAFMASVYYCPENLRSFTVTASDKRGRKAATWTRMAPLVEILAQCTKLEHVDLTFYGPVGDNVQTMAARLGHIMPHSVTRLRLHYARFSGRKVNLHALLEAFPSVRDLILTGDIKLRDRARDALTGEDPYVSLPTKRAHKLGEAAGRDVQLGEATILRLSLSGIELCSTVQPVPNLQPWPVEHLVLENVVLDTESALPRWTEVKRLTVLKTFHLGQSDPVQWQLLGSIEHLDVPLHNGGDWGLLFTFFFDLLQNHALQQLTLRIPVPDHADQGWWDWFREYRTATVAAGEQNGLHITVVAEGGVELSAQPAAHELVQPFWRRWLARLGL